MQATQIFSQRLAHYKDPIAQFLSQVDGEEERIGWAIAAEAFHQSIGLYQRVELLERLQKVFPECWQLPAPREQDILHELYAFPWFRGWVLERHTPGILYSIGDWLRKQHEGGGRSLAQKPISQLWRELSKIYFMGKTSKVRPKVLHTLFRLGVQSPFGLGHPLKMDSLPSGNPWPLPISAGARRWLAIFGPNPKVWMDAQDDVARLQYYQKMYRGLDRQNPAGVCWGLAFFLEPYGTEYLCRTTLGGCLHCPFASLSILTSQCPGKKL